jgi:signal transduction histidine kinase
LLESITDIVLVGNHEGIYKCNDLAKSFFGISDVGELNTIFPSFGGKTIIRDAKNDKSLRFEDLPFNKALEGEPYKMQITFKNEGGPLYYFKCSGSPVMQNNEIIGAVLVMSDCTYETIARKEIKKAMNEVSEIRELNKRLETYGFAIAHDINSPLHGIQGLSHLILKKHRDVLKPEVVAFLEMIYKSSLQMSEYVISLLKLSRLEPDSLEKRWLVLDSIIDDIISTLKVEHDSMKHKISYEKGIKIYADKNLLGAVLQNLITNAIKFTSEQDSPEIYIGSELNKSRESIFYISDNGIGFSKSDEEKIFIPKFRTALAEKFPGKGIGLATVQQIVNSHEGRIWAKGEPGKGATFYLYFPSEDEAVKDKVA